MGESSNQCQMSIKQSVTNTLLYESQMLFGQFGHRKVMVKILLEPDASGVLTQSTRRCINHSVKLQENPVWLVVYRRADGVRERVSALCTQDTSANETRCVCVCVFLFLVWKLRLCDMKKKKRDLCIMHESFGQCIAICFKEAFSQPL